VCATRVNTRSGPVALARARAGIKWVAKIGSRLFYHPLPLGPFLPTRPSLSLSLSLSLPSSVRHPFRPRNGWEREARSGGRLREMTRSRSKTNTDCGRGQRGANDAHTRSYLIALTHRCVSSARSCVVGSRYRRDTRSVKGEIYLGPGALARVYR